MEPMLLETYLKQLRLPDVSAALPQSGRGSRPGQSGL